MSYRSAYGRKPTWDIWRTDENGEKHRIARLTTKYEAEALLEYLPDNFEMIKDE